MNISRTLFSFTDLYLNIVLIFFQISGLGLLAVGVWSIFWRYHLVQVQVTHVYAFIVYTVLVIGVLITIVNIIGYIGVWKENRCTILYVSYSHFHSTTIYGKTTVVILFYISLLNFLPQTEI